MNYQVAPSQIADWEVDLMLGKGQFTILAILIERKTAYSKIIKLSGKDADNLAMKVVKAIATQG